ncbi:MAG: hypothetical protein PQJ61_01005 [Spirochaetales bacterium]|uniref:Ferredoxin n=1 Tax=Candidatus Thalassospirochaeta sargassi TaxID=3119039 RepID=A0AAJ1I9R3_9SPIO|nr:hypothetical protein [Spirochaetales bacterium]
MAGKGQGKGGGGFGIGGSCICSSCGEKIPHQRGVSCIDMKCPSCGKRMIREDLYNKKKGQE